MSGTMGSPQQAKSELPQLGRRGGGWVAVQFVLLVAIAASALLGLGPRGALGWVAYLAGGALLGLGVALLVAGGAGLGSALTPFPEPRSGEALRTSGVYGLVRHPIYGGVLLVALGWSVVFATPVGLALTLVLALFFELKSRREEHLLEQIHPEYPEYRRHTRRRFIPHLW
jgi:protein-S-isoprenylcysteine O-methyltransferase Ste14